MHIFVGLGNHGEKYKITRHNIGFMVIDALAKKLDANWENIKKFQAQIIRQDNFILVKPQTFMNESGRSLRAVLDYYKLLPKTFGLISKKNQDLSKILTVIHDDLDIEFGKYKIAVDSRSAGHNGVQSIIDNLKTKKIKRLRIGIKPRPENKIPTADYVLQRFSTIELQGVNKIINELILELIA